ncbi:hypothetical protein D3C81_1152420 [compost metagenome]
MGVFKQRFDATAQSEQIPAGLNQDRNTGGKRVLIAHAGCHAIGNRFYFSGHPQALQVRTHHTGGMGLHCRIIHPVSICTLTLHQQFGDMPDHLQTTGFDQAPECIMWCQAAELRVKTANGTHRLTVERQLATYVRQAAHQIEIEIGLEDRMTRFTPIVCTFIAVQTQTVGIQCHALGHDHQCVGMKAIPRTQ